jgi:hypothetical protein
MFILPSVLILFCCAFIISSRMPFVCDKITKEIIFLKFETNVPLLDKKKRPCYSISIQEYYNMVPALGRETYEWNLPYGKEGKTDGRRTAFDELWADKPGS